MPEDRLRHDHDDVEQLGDLIEARDEGTSHLARDVDTAGTDIDIPEDIDVDEALTIPHPKRRRKPGEDIELMGTPKGDDTDINWAESQEEMLPSDYEGDYNDALTTNLYDEDTVAEGQIEDISHVEPDELIEEVPMVTQMPKGFHAEEEAGEEAAAPPREEERRPGELESAMQTGTDEEDISIEDKFGGEVTPEEARRALWHAEPGAAEQESEEESDRGSRNEE